jgi:hypothetical protein
MGKSFVAAKSAPQAQRWLFATFLWVGSKDQSLSRPPLLPQKSWKSSCHQTTRSGI